MMAPPCHSPSPNFSSPTTPPNSRSFFPSSTTTTSSSSASSSVQSPVSSYPRFSVPFSWEAQPGVPKQDPNNNSNHTISSSRTPLQPPPTTTTTTTLRPPPTLRTNSDPFTSLRGRGSTRSRRTTSGPGAEAKPAFVRDPFAAALAECCAGHDNDPQPDYAVPSAPDAGSTRRWAAAAEYYCSPPRAPNPSSIKGANCGSRRWAAEYYCSPPRAGTSSGTGKRFQQLFGSLFRLRSLNFHASCKTASAVADSVAFIPSYRPDAARFRSAGSTPTTTASPYRTNSIRLNQRRRAR